MGIRFADPGGAMKMSKALYDAGLWAMFAGLDPSVLQFKAGLLVDDAYCDEAAPIAIALGARPEEVPRSRAALQQYIDRMHASGARIAYGVSAA